MADLLNNPYYCILCNKQYNEDPKDRHSTDAYEYCRFMGICGEECYDHCPQQLIVRLAKQTYNHGAKAKENHKWYLKNVPNYK